MTAITCACGLVRLDLTGHPMTSVICHCESCRTAGLAFDSRSPAAPIVDDAGGTAVVLWRKDQVRCVRGCDRLEAHRLKPDSPSRRMVASCCGTPMFGDFTKGFWISIYRGRVPDAPAPSMRVMTGDMPAGVALPGDLPGYRGRPAKFLFRLLGTWARMGFRTARLAGIAD